MMRLEDDPDYQAALAEQRAESMGYNYSEENSKRLAGKWLAELLGVSPAAVSMAASKEHQCQGYPIYKWKDPDGRYWVPLSVYKDLTKDIGVESGRSAERRNPSSDGDSSELEGEPSRKSKEIDKTDSKNVGGGDDIYSKEKPEEQEQPEKVEKALGDGFINNSGNISLLPEGQNYVEPVIAGSLGSVGSSLVETDTPNGRAVMYTGSAGICAYAGYKFADDHWVGAIIGALFGLGTAYLGNMNYNRSNPSSSGSSHMEPNNNVHSNPLPKSKDSENNWGEIMQNAFDAIEGSGAASSEIPQMESVDLPTGKTS